MTGRIDTASLPARPGSAMRSALTRETGDDLAGRRARAAAPDIEKAVTIACGCPDVGGGSVEVCELVATG